MKENNKKLLEYAGIGILILILLFLLLSKKPKPQNNSTPVNITPAHFTTTQPLNFNGISSFSLIPFQLKIPTNNTNSGGFCPPDNKISDYVWGGKSGTA